MNKRKHKQIGFEDIPNRATAEYCLKQWQESTLKDKRVMFDKMLADYWFRYV